jgi:ubiquinone biosynthesis monooxygenase Coq7
MNAKKIFYLSLKINFYFLSRIHEVLIDQIIIETDKALRTLSGVTTARRPVPHSQVVSDIEMTEQEIKHAAGLMRVNHVGEICAQALYQAQRLTSRSTELKQKLAHAASEEEDHLNWCAQRLKELGSRPSLLNPIWYAGSFAMGLAAGLAGDDWSLGFVAETEKQVEQHLDHHLITLPTNDFSSKAIVDQMRLEEIEHGQMAKVEGAKDLPNPIRFGMRLISRAMTKTAYYL